MLEDKKDILSMTEEEIQEILADIKKPRFHAGQMIRWIMKGAQGFDEMSDLPFTLRSELKEKFYFSKVKIRKKLKSSQDSTVKYVYELDDRKYIESVFMEYHHGNSICISTQVGCKMGCSFCASTKAGFERNLTSGEMLEQIRMTQQDLGKKITHIVLMGIGEPLDNYTNVLKFLKMVHDKDRFHISMRNISLSTCGLVDQMKRLAQEKLQLTLSVSLHAPNNRIRNQLMPVNRKWPIEELIDACKLYIIETGRRISFEYTMVCGVNDSLRCADELAARLKGILCHVNLIPVNQIKERNFVATDRKKILDFQKRLKNHGINATIRRTLGEDIHASCGQLRRRECQNEE